MSKPFSSSSALSNKSARSPGATCAISSEFNSFKAVPLAASSACRLSNAAR
jgi:hypothetical protein